MLYNFANGYTDILIGTQMVAKGLDFERCTLVGVINADLQLFLPNFRASEKTFQFAYTGWQEGLAEVLQCPAR